MYLTGIKPTGKLHIGNYISTIKPILNKDAIILIANQHAIISNPKQVEKNTIDLFKIFYSFGFKNVILQSDIPEISELNWILSCNTEIGHLLRSHAYKSLKNSNIQNGYNENKNVNAGLFNYPTLMTADNVMFDAKYVSIGPDQKSHIELAKTIVNKFNHIYKTNILKVPIPVISNFNVLGFDGRKMSKGYNNTIPLFCPEKKLKKHIFSMKTNIKNINEPKYFYESPVCEIYKCISNSKEINDLNNKMKNGIGWGEVKQIVFDKLNNEIKNVRKKYNESEFQLKNRTVNYEILSKIKYKINEIKKIVYGY